MSAKPSCSSRHQRLCLLSLDPPHLHVVAPYNPSQLQLDEAVSWSPSATSRDDHPPLEFACVRPRTLAVELFLDTYEEPRGQQNVKTRYLDPLSRLLRVLEPDGPEERRRPPMVELRWEPGLPPFRGVVESMSTKITMFLSDGTPVRATCSLKLLEAAIDSFGRRRAG